MTDHLRRGAEWRERALESLLPISVPLAVAAGRKPAWEDVVQVDERRVLLADECLARPLYDDEDYVESSGKARRRAGLAVLGLLRERPDLDPLTAFEQVLAERTGRLPEHLLGWVDQLGRGGRAALAQEAVGYATAVATWVPPRRMGNVAVCGPSDWFAWAVPGRALRIKGRCDALNPRGARPPDRRLLVVAGGLGRAELRAGHAALAYTLTTASLPKRVTVLVPATGKEDVDVDDALLEAALERVGAAVQAALAARFGPTAPTSPGVWCRACARLDECDDGQAWLAAHPVRVGGLLPPPPA